MLDRAAIGFQWIRTCPNSPAGGIPSLPAAAMPGPDAVAHHPAAPDRAATAAPAPGARPGPGMASTVRRVDVDPSASGHPARGRAEGSPWPRRICPVCSPTRRSFPRGPARPPS